MKKYNIPVEWIATGHFEIEAKDLEDLKEKLKDKNTILSQTLYLDGELFDETVDYTYKDIDEFIDGLEEIEEVMK